MKKTTPTPPRSDVLRHKTSKTFAADWQGRYNVDDFFSGGEHFPDIYRRQDRLVGAVMNAALGLYVYEELKQDTAVDNLGAFIVPQAQKSLKEDVAEIRKKSNVAERNAALFERVTRLMDEKGVISHMHLIEGDKWQNYCDARDQYNQTIKDYMKSLHDWEQDRHQSPPPAATWEKAPPDPRIAAANEKVSKILEIYSPSPKTESSVRAKMEEHARKYGSKGYKVGSHIRDFNRLLILPSTPEVASDFFRILEHVSPPKQDKDGKKHPRVYEEPWEVTNYGYFNKKGLVAMDRLMESGTEKRTEGIEGMLGEIKVVSKQMRIAEGLTGPVREMFRVLHDIRQYIPDSAGKKVDTAKIKRNRDKLHELYEKSKKTFEERCEEHFPGGAPYKFPENLIKGTESKASSYTTMSHKLEDLLLKINTDQLAQEQGHEWSLLFLRTAIQQRMVADRTKTGLQHKKDAQQGEEALAIIPSPWLDKVAKSKYLDVRQIEQDVKKGLPRSRQSAGQER